MGESNHFRTTEEQLSTTYEDIFEVEPQFIDSDGWDLIDGKEVFMTNITNYNLDLVFDSVTGDIIGGTGMINGSNHSIINIIDTDDEGEIKEIVVTLEAHGTIVGNFFTGAVLDMNWTSVKDSGTFEGRARGKITGSFYWVYDDSVDGLVASPYGNFTITGTYK